MNNKNIISVQIYRSPCGILALGSLGNQLCLCDWQTANDRKSITSRIERLLHANLTWKQSETTDNAASQLDEYFSGKRKVFDVPLLFAGTDFQKTVWMALSQIPFGKTVSYTELAELIGLPNAVRPVANANRANAISIFVPCHRVIGSDHSLTGYGGGLSAKRFLLNLESGKLRI